MPLPARAESHHTVWVHEIAGGPLLADVPFRVHRRRLVVELVA